MASLIYFNGVEPPTGNFSCLPCEFNTLAINNCLKEWLTQNQEEWIYLVDLARWPHRPNLHLILDDLHQSTHLLTHFSVPFLKIPENFPLYFYSPLWMLHLNPQGTKNYVSWKTLPACIKIHRSVLLKTGLLNPRIIQPNTAWLDWGLRTLKMGFIPIHTLHHNTPHVPNSQDLSLLAKDSYHFALEHLSKAWYVLYLFFWHRKNFGMLSSLIGMGALIRYLFQPNAQAAYRPSLKEDPVQNDTLKKTKLSLIPNFHHINERESRAKIQHPFSILIPTLNRPTQLATLLKQISALTSLPTEVIIIDQSTPPVNIKSHQATAPFKIVYEYQTHPGQSDARNRGLNLCKTPYLFFVDDDCEIDPHIIQRHLECLISNQADVSCGSALEPGFTPKTDKQSAKVSAVFATGNSLIHYNEKIKSVRFDPFFNHNARADLDYGTQLYMQGALILYHPGISVIHRHHPSGGLRTFNERTLTHQQWKKRGLAKLPLPKGELYWALKHFPPNQVRQHLYNQLLTSLLTPLLQHKNPFYFFLQLILLPVHIKLFSTHLKSINSYAHQ